MKTTLFAAALSVASVSAQANTESAQVVSQFIDAFNQHNVEKMLSHTTDSVHWGHVKGNKMTLEASNQTEFGTAMNDYFQTLPAAKAEIISMMDSGSFVTIVEQISWTNEEQRNTQCSIGVYQLSGDKISTISYYPPHTCEARVAPAPDVELTVAPDIGVLQSTQQ